MLTSKNLPRYTILNPRLPEFNIQISPKCSSNQSVPFQASPVLRRDYKGRAIMFASARWGLPKRALTKDAWVTRDDHPNKTLCILTKTS